MMEKILVGFLLGFCFALVVGPFCYAKWNHWRTFCRVQELFEDYCRRHQLDRTSDCLDQQRALKLYGDRASEKDRRHIEEDGCERCIAFQEFAGSENYKALKIVLMKFGWPI